MPKAFISYARRDEKLAHQFADALRCHGFDIWRTDDVVAPGESWAARLLDEIARSDYVFPIVSRESQADELVASEIALALAEAQKGSTRVVPVLVEGGVEIPYFLRRIQAIDFTRPQSPAVHRQIEMLRRARNQQTPCRNHLQTELEGLRFSKLWLDREKTLLEAQRTLWSSAVSLAVGVLAIVLSGTAAILSLPDLRFLVPDNTDASFVTGVLFGVAASGLSFWLLRKSNPQAGSRAAGP
jgi:hypothetical protein